MITQILIALGLLGSIIAVYVKMEVEIAKLKTTIIFFQHDLDRKEKALLELERSNKQDHEKIISKIDKLIEK